MIIPLGGGGSKVVASITVSYPAGSTLTCTLGSKVLTAKDTSGKWVFGLPTTGSWVVKAVKGSQSASKAVKITAEGQVETVTLSYALYIFTSGKGMTSGFVMKTLDEDHGWSVANEKIIWSTDTVFGGAGFWVTPSQDFSKFKTLKIDYKCNDRYQDRNTVIIGIGPDVPVLGQAGEWVAKMEAPYSTTRAVKSVDLSQITATTKYYIKATAYGITGEIYNIWLE